MRTLQERFFSCARAWAAVGLATSLVGEAWAQPLPDGLADHYKDCVGVELFDNNQPPVFSGESLRALPAPAQTDLDVGIAAGNCLADATGNLWAYDPSFYLFRTGIRYRQGLDSQNRALEARRQEERAAQAEEAARIAAEIAFIEREREARRQEERAAQAEEAARIAAEIAFIERERRAAVWLATRDACVDLYRDDGVAAMTNQICQPLFLEIGLPSD